MTVRLREQNDALKREKVYLADLLADIAHLLHTPLTSANLVFTLLKDEQNPADGGRITVQCDDTPLFTALTIRDSGPGFDETELPYRFDRFYQSGAPIFRTSFRADSSSALPLAVR